MGFNDIIGQKEVISSLTAQIEKDKVGHAYVFCGPKGIGKQMLATAFSELLLCENISGLKACGECMPCRLFINGTNPDFHMIEPGDSSISVEEIRQLQGEILIKPMYSKRKVYLITDSDKMTVQAQNCLLKTLEEPPGFACIILTTTNYGALLETVQSRTLRYTLRKNTLLEVRQVIQQRLGDRKIDIDFITNYSAGIIGRALELADSEDFVKLRDAAIMNLFTISRSELKDIFEIYDFFEANKGSVDIILDVMISVYRDLLVLKKATRENILINSDKKDMILNNAAGFTPLKIMKCIDIVEMTRKNLKYNANYQLSIEVMLMKLREEI